MTEMEQTNEEDLEDIKNQLAGTMGEDELHRQLKQRKESVTTNESPPKLLQKSNTNKESIPESTAVSPSESGTNVKKEEQKVGTNLIEKESVETGSVSIKIYLYYAKYMGLFGVMLSITCQLLYTGFSLGTNYWLNVWADNQLNDTCWDLQEPFYNNDTKTGMYIFQKIRIYSVNQTLKSFFSGCLT